MCEGFHKLANTLKREQQSTEPDPWLAEDDERRNLADREILERYVDQETSCLIQKEEDELMDMLYRYKEEFSLRDEIDTCPNIKVEIDVVVVDKTPFKLTLCPLTNIRA